MKFETLETLVLLLLFGVPGAVFLYAYSRAFSPTERVNYIRQQFPFELTVFYLTASAAIHFLLLAISLFLLNLVARYFNDPHALTHIIDPLLNVTQADVRSLTLSASAVLVYFGVSLVVAHYAGKWWGNRYIPSVPLWCRELVELRAVSLKQGDSIQLKLLLRDGIELEGQWDGFRFLGGKQDAFEITLRQPKRNQVIWVDSSNIAEMTATCGQEKRKFLFRQRKEKDAEVANRGTGETGQDEQPAS